MKKQITINSIDTTVSTVEEFAALNLSISDMKDLYNHHTGSSISKFSDKKTAIRRTFEALPEVEETKTPEIPFHTHMTPVTVPTFSANHGARRSSGKPIPGSRPSTPNHTVNPAHLPAKARRTEGESDRDKMRAFLTVGKEFKISEIADLLNTDTKNANTGIQLLKKRPGKHHQELILEKVEGQKATWRVTQAPVRID